LALRIEAQPQHIAIVIADRAHSLPGRKCPQRQKPGDDGWGRIARALPQNSGRRSHHEAMQEIFAHVEGQPLISNLLLRADDISRRLHDNAFRRLD
jgi:hypothetical protein